MASARHAKAPGCTLTALLLGALASTSCASRSHGDGWSSRVGEPPAAGLEAPTRGTAVSAAFDRHWRDGRAELSGYRISTTRYGEPRQGHAVLIYVTEPMDSATWVKDDGGRRVPPARRIEVLKLNHLLRFRTGIYDYSVMTSVFSPLDGGGRERFAPAKISLSAQEWCGHVYQQIYPKGDRFHSELHSYFGAEGDRRETVRAAPGTLYEDALLIQLRELDGPFAAGGDWSGQLVPSLWTRRKAHVELRPVPATIRRSEGRLDGHGPPVTRFTLAYDGQRRVFDVERAAPHRVLGWSDSDGERARLLRTVRKPYWRLHGNADAALVRELGLAPYEGGAPMLPGSGPR